MGSEQGHKAHVRNRENSQQRHKAQVSERESRDTKHTLLERANLDIKLQVECGVETLS